MQPDTRDNAALMMVGVATLGLALKGIFAKLAFAAGLSVGVLVLLRLCMALPLFWAGAAVRPGGNPLSLPAKDWLRSMAVGGFFLVATLTDFTAIHLLGAGLSRVVLFTFPLIVVLLNAALERRAPKAHHLVAFALAYGGLLVVLAPGGSEVGPNFAEGVAWAFLAAASYAVYLVLGQGLMRRIGSPRFTVAANVGATGGVLIYGLAFMDLSEISLTPEGFGWLSLIVVFSTVIPLFLLYEGIQRIGASRASVMSLAGPAITIAIAWAVLDESLSLVQCGGFVLVLLGVAVLEGLIRLPAVRVPAIMRG